MADNAIILARAKVEIEAAADNARPARISALAYGGGVLGIGGTRYVINLDGMATPDTVPLLRDHENQVGAIVGVVKPTKKNGSLYIEGSIARGTVAGDQVIALSLAGVELAVSVGVEPKSRTYIAPRQNVQANGQTFTADDDGLVFVSKSNLKEVSLVPVGADRSATATIAASGNRGGVTMTFTEYLAAKGYQDESILTRELRAALLASYEAEHKLDDAARFERIEAICRDHAGIMGKASERCEPLRAAAYRQTISPAALDAGLSMVERDWAKADLLHAQLPVGPGIHSSSHDAAGTPEVLQAALMKHIGHETLAEKTLGAPVLQAAADLRATSFLDILKASLYAEGRDIPADRNQMIRAAFSTHTLTPLLSTTGNKLLEESYRAFPSAARQLARKLNANDFKTHTGYRMTGDSKLLEVGPAGLITHGTLSQASYTFAVKTFARMFGITRQDIVNDDLSAFAEMPSIIGRGAALQVEQTFWTLVLANTGSYFHADNSNYISGATTVLAMEGLRQAVQALRQQTDQQGEPVLVEPKLLVVPPELEATADALFASTNVVVAVAVGSATETIPDSNPYKGKYQPIVVPYLSNSNYSGYSATAWYLFGSPADVAAFGVAYLSGQETPVIEQSEADFNTLGVQFRGYLDFGVCQVDHRGAVKSAGA